MQHITDGDIITAESSFDPEGPAYFDCFKLAADGSRRVLFYEFISDDPASSQMWLRIHRDQPIPADALGMTAVGFVRDRNWRFFHIRDLQANRAYIGYDFSVDPHSLVPVNQIPYILRWRQHVGQIVHDFYTTYAADAFVLENNLSGLSPADVSLTSEQEYSFEIITNQIRKLVGITWGRIDAYAAIRPEGSDTWKAQTATLQASGSQAVRNLPRRGLEDRPDRGPRGRPVGLVWRGPITGILPDAQCRRPVGSR